MPTPQGFWRNDKMMDASRLSQFGPTLRLLTEQHGEAVLTSFLAAFPVRTYRSQGKERGLTAINQGCGQSSSALLARFDQEKHSLRTAQCSLFEDFPESCVILPRWGSMRDGAVYQDSIPAMKRSGIDCGLLRRPLYTDHKFYVLSKQQMITRRQQGKTPMNWMQQAVELSDLKKAWANVRFAEALMRWPTNWTDLKPLGTAKIHSWRQQHSPNLQEGSDAA